VQADDGWLLAAGRGFVHLGADGSLRPIAEVAPAGTRMNDAACDPQGRLWAGTMADDHHAGGGALYRLDWTGRTELMLDGLTISNGLGWSPDGGTMYLVDSGPRVIHAFAFDRDRGTISDERVLVTLDEEAGAPDGMTVDGAGDLWVAIYGGGRVPRYRAHPVRSQGPVSTGSSSRPRPRAGWTSSAAPSPPPASCTGSTRMRTAVRHSRFVPIRTGGRT
jgi:sugar lactone lactonase YvrE